MHYFNVPGELRDSKYPVALHSFQIIRFAWRPLSRISYVLVVPPKPRPGPVDIELYGLMKQSMSWEMEVKAGME
jgi:hypothetical protein